MKSMNGDVHAVVGDTFVMGLHDLTIYETIVKFIVTKIKNRFFILILFQIH